MFFGIGIDSSSKKRLQEVAKNNVRFRNLFMMEVESDTVQVTNLSNFSIFEALFKALDCPTSFTPGEVCISRTDGANPSISLTGSMRKRYEGFKFIVSVTHHKDVIIAVVVVYSNLES